MTATTPLPIGFNGAQSVANKNGKRVCPCAIERESSLPGRFSPRSHWGQSGTRPSPVCYVLNACPATAHATVWDSALTNSLGAIQMSFGMRAVLAGIGAGLLGFWAVWRTLIGTAFDSLPGP